MKSLTLIIHIKAIEQFLYVLLFICTKSRAGSDIWAVYEILSDTIKMKTVKPYKFCCRCFMLYKVPLPTSGLLMKS